MTRSIGCASRDGVGYLKLSGDLRYDCAGPLEALVERWFAHDGEVPRAVVIDLNEARFMDSTVIGLVAAIAREMLARDLPVPTVFSTNPEINQLLGSLRLDEVFTVVERATDRRPDVLTTTELVDGEDQCSATAILHAHEALIELNAANGVAFQSVVDTLRDELTSK